MLLLLAGGQDLSFLVVPRDSYCCKRDINKDSLKELKGSLRFLRPAALKLEFGDPRGLSLHEGPQNNL